MRKVIFILLAVAGLAATSGLAAARDGCGRGFYWNGYQCAPMQYAPEPRIYDPRPGYYYGQRQYNPNAGCPRGWTRQGGVCKPYTGR